MRITKSVKRSISAIPTNFDKGTFSYLFTTPSRASSPPRGIIWLVKGRIWVDMCFS